jgi:outer membrane protein OmpA-like peptidoglycan-associated protein
MQHKHAGILEILTLCGVVMFSVSTANADVPNPSLYLGLYGGGHLTIDNEWFLQDPSIITEKTARHGGLFGLRLGYMINHVLAAEGDASVMAYKSSGSGNINIAVAATADVLFHLTRGNWVPYIIAGGGAYQSLSGDLGSDMDWQARWGLGIRAMANSTVSPRLEIKHIMTDAYTEGKMFASNVEVTLGVDFFMKKGEKALPPAPVDVDKDDDGVPDSTDNCPDQAGTEANNGCPVLDRDHDGVLDKDDACPDEAGSESNRGCPLIDRDRDGVLDKDDACPDEAGPESNRGCPLLDRDHDGVLDRDDACPEVPGLVEANGCMPEKAAKMFSGTFEGINFASGKAIIMRNSYTNLNRAAAVLNEFPSIRLIIEGHTDNIGQPYKNQALSEDRAQAVKDYFVSKGIDAMRIETAGYGDTRPVANNRTATGRAENRRIEIKIKGQ